MQTKLFIGENAESEWKESRLGLITGTRIHECKQKRDGTYGKGFWEVLAERVCEPDNLTSIQAMARGNDLEEIAIKELEKVTGLEFDQRKILWVSDEIVGTALSPDGVGITKTSTACEIKCLNSAHHLEAYFSKDYPKSSTLYNQYKAQARGYFQVNKELETLYVGMYDPRTPVPFFYFTINREDIENELENDKISLQVALSELSRLENLLIKF
jgi:hypothetical protein